MAIGVLIVGESGAGKSASAEGLNPKETFIINIANKPLPFRGWRNNYILWSRENHTGNMYYTTDPDEIVACIKYVSNKRPEINMILIDDFQYMSSFELFDKIKVKSFDKWTDLAANIAKVSTVIKDMRDDLIVTITNHVEEAEDMEGNRKLKAKTVGKLVDKNLTLEGLFSIVLFAKAKKDKEKGVRYVFETRNNGENTCKSPKDMFKDMEIPNDLELVRKTILEYEISTSKL